MRINLGNTPLFRGMTPEEIDAFLNSMEGIRRQMGYGA